MVTLCGVYDKKAQSFILFFTSKTPGTAMRQFTDMINNPQHPWNAFAEDYDLFKLAVIDEASAAISGDDPEFICNGDLVLRKEV